MKIGFYAQFVIGTEIDYIRCRGDCALLLTF